MTWRIVLAVAVVCLVAFAAVGGSYALSLHAISRSQSRWCTSLEILTYKPVKRNEGAVYQLYVALLQLEKDYGCHR